MEDQAERLTPSPFLVQCQTDGPQEVFEPFKEWVDQTFLEVGGQYVSTIECPKCGSLLNVFEKIASPDKSFSLTIPKGWQYQFEESQDGKTTRLTVSSLGKPQEENSDRLALLTIIVTPGENNEPPKFTNFTKLEKTTNVSGVEVDSYQFKPEGSETAFLTSKFSLNGKTYQVRMKYNPEQYDSGKDSHNAEDAYQTILGSLSPKN